MKKLIIGLVFLIYSLSFGWDIGQVIQRIKSAEGINANVSIQTDPQKIKNNIRAIGDLRYNAGVAVGRTADQAVALGSAVVKSKGDIDKTADRYQDSTAINEAYSRLTPEEADLIKNPDKYDLVSQQYVADKFNKAYSEIRGLTHAKAVLFDDAKLENEQGVTGKASKTTAFYDPDLNTIYLEADKIQNDNKMAHALGHEAKRQDMKQKDSREDDQRAIAFEAGERSKKALERELKYKRVSESTKPTYVRSSADKDAILQGSQQASKVKNVQPYIDWKNKDGVEIVLSNKKSRKELQKINDNIIEQTGKKDKDFRLRVSGGDRYIGKDKLHYSSTHQKIERKSDINSPHLVENGARAIDVQLKGVTKQEFKKAHDKTAFKGGNYLDHYKTHVHISLPNIDENKVENQK